MSEQDVEGDQIYVDHSPSSSEPDPFLTYEMEELTDDDGFQFASDDEIDDSEEEIDRLLNGLPEQYIRLYHVNRVLYRTRQIPVLVVPEYKPQARYIDFSTNPGPDPTEGTFYTRYGVPHEVSTPEGDFIPFKVWMQRYARGFQRFIAQPDLPANPELFGDAYDLGGLFNFFRIVRARIKRHTMCNFWTRMASLRMNILLRYEFSSIGEGISDEHAAEMRLIAVCYYLFPEEFTSAEASERVREFIASQPVKQCFREYEAAYLVHNPETPNSFWSVVQPRLGDTRIDLLRPKYGSFDTDPNDVDKDNWDHEDHVCRFIICVYDVLKRFLNDAGVRPSTAVGFETYVYTERYSPDMTDQHWFGWALHMFLVKCWQHNQAFPTPEYDLYLAPVLHDSWVEGRRAALPATQVKMVDLDPDTKWNDDVFPNRVPTAEAVQLGFLDVNDLDPILHPTYESDTDPMM
ncbi:hypothetical protein Hte_000754 [Hypoxylon texense]